MAADPTANSAVIAGRSHTSTRPVSSCRVSSASNPGHSGPLGGSERESRLVRSRSIHRHQPQPVLRWLLWSDESGTC